MISVLLTKRWGKFGIRRVSNWKREAGSQLNFSLRWRQFGNSLALPSVSNTLSRPGKHLRSDRSRWRIPEKSAHATKGVYRRGQQFYICLFSFTSGLYIFPDSIWKAEIWSPQITDKNRCRDFECSFWPDREQQGKCNNVLFVCLWNPEEFKVTAFIF